jgi:hypothetical protein
MFGRKLLVRLYFVNIVGTDQTRVTVRGEVLAVPSSAWSF